MVILGDLLVYLFGLLRVYLLHELGRHTGVDASRFDDRLAEHDRTGRYDGTFAYDSMIHHDGAHADQRPVFNLRPVDGDVVPDGDVVANLDGGFLVERMQDGAVLDIDAIPDADGVHIAADDRPEPDAASFANHHVANDRGIVGQEGIRAYLGRKAPY